MNCLGDKLRDPTVHESSLSWKTQETCYRTLTPLLQTPLCSANTSATGITCTFHTNAALTAVPPPWRNFPPFTEVHSLTSMTLKQSTLSSTSQLAAPRTVRSLQIATDRLQSTAPKRGTFHPPKVTSSSQLYMVFSRAAQERLETSPQISQPSCFKVVLWCPFYNYA